MAKIKSKCTVDNVKDKLGKLWTCEVEITEGAIGVSPVGYDNWYPMILSKDRVFVTNVKNALYNIGIYKELSVDTTDDAATVLNFYGVEN